ncbi:hypothetical protein AWENTII_004876 [Aspergillus wentii]
MASNSPNSGSPSTSDGGKLGAPWCSTEGGLLIATGQEKQKSLLSAETGHFSMIRALHLADLVTELNGFCGGKPIP